MSERCNWALVVGDRRFLRNEDGKWYTEGAIGAESGERYLRWFKRVTVVGRAGRVKGRDTKRLNRIDSPGLAVVTLPNLSGITVYIRNLSRARKTLSTLIQNHDAVIARLPTQLGLEAVNLGLVANKVVAVELGGCSWDNLMAYGTLKARMLAPISFWQMRSAVAQAPWVSYVTQQYLQRRYPAAQGARVVACSNVELPPPDRKPLEQRLKRIKECTRPLIFGTIGSLHGQFKGVHHALEALGRAKPRLPPFQYRVLGGGNPLPWHKRIEQCGLSENVFLDGTLPAGQPVLEWLDHVDVYLQPSLREGVPRALIEAMSRGCPSLASDIAGIPELLPSHVLHRAGDVPGLSALLEAAVTADFMSTNAVRNWERAAEFTGERLDAIRNEFWGAFAIEAARQSAVRQRGA